MLSLPIAFSSAIGVFAPVFSRPVWQHVKVLMTGAVLAPGKRTVTAFSGRRATPTGKCAKGDREARSSLVTYHVF